MMRRMTFFGTDSLVKGIAFMVACGYLVGGIGCNREEPIRIGFVGTLTGKESAVGISGRNGVLLAVEQLNAAGGIAGRPVELLVRDDRGDASVAPTVDGELIRKGVIAIVGHTSGAMSLAALPLVNREQLLLISPTSATDALTGIDDFFFRVVNSHRFQTDRLADYAYNTLRIRRMAAVSDLSNPDYAGAFCHNFQAEFEYLGGEFVNMTTFTAGAEVQYDVLVEELTAAAPDGLLLVASGYDAAMICHQLKKLGSRIPVLSSAWAMTEDLLHHGGQAVEGLTFCSPYDENSPAVEYVAFRRQFRSRFGAFPDFAALNAFEAARLIFAAAKAPSPSQLKATILQQGYFPGLLWDISINRFGDAHMGQFLIQVIDGQLQAIETWTPDTGKPKIEGIK